MWFLAGTFGTVAERTCTVPADKALLIPIGTALFWIPVDADTVAGLRAKIAEDRTTELEMTVDGVALQGLWNFRFESPSTFFFATADLNSFFGVTGPGFEDGHPYEALAAGYLVMLEPLPVGQHTIKWRTKAVQPAIFPSVQVFELNITYHLTVE